MDPGGLAFQETKEALKSEFKGLDWPLRWDKVAEGNMEDLACAFMGILALKTKLLFFLTKDCIKKVVELFDPSLSCSAETVLGKELFLRQSEEYGTGHTIDEIFLSSMSSERSEYELLSSVEEHFHTDLECVQKFFSIPDISVMDIPNKFVTFRFSVLATNNLVHAVRHSDERALKAVLSFCRSPVDTSVTYAAGRIRVKSPHTYLVDLSVGPLQIGMPPDTIKDSMQQGEDVPRLFVLPADLFETGIDQTYVDVEFPVFFNFFIKKAFLNREKRMILIGRQDHLDRVRVMFKESIFGPNEDEIYVEEEIDPQRKAEGYHVDLLAEMAELRWRNPDNSKVDLDLFVDFRAFSDDTHTVRVSLPSQETGNMVSVSIVSNTSGLLSIAEDNMIVAALGMDSAPHLHRCRASNVQPLRIKDEVNISSSTSFDSHLSSHHKKRDMTINPAVSALRKAPEFRSLRRPSVSEELMRNARFSAPVLGITFLGTGHGFDKDKATTGFIIWINGRGIAVDPPTGTMQYLTHQGVSLNLVQKVILTHTHADHDSGLIQMIMAERKIEVYTTKTIHGSYLRKIKAVTGCQDIESYYFARHVPIGGKYSILGADFDFDYSYHSIPTVRFRMEFFGKSIAYSSDTFYDPAKYVELMGKGVFSPLRFHSLCNFLWSSDFIIHENGIPPIHTSAGVLNALPNAIKAKMFIVHTSGLPETVTYTSKNGEKTTVPVTNLNIPPCGLSNTVEIRLMPQVEGAGKVFKKLTFVSNVPLFAELPTELVLELVMESNQREFHPGQVIICEGDQSDELYIVRNGVVTVHPSSPEEQAKTIFLTSGHLFGENALSNNRTAARNATVRAHTFSTLLVFPGALLDRILDRHCMTRSRLGSQVTTLNTNRPFVTGVLSQTFLFQGLSRDQHDAIASMFSPPRLITPGTVLMEEGELGNGSMFVVQSGTLSIRRSYPSSRGGVKTREIMRMEKGSVVGEMSLLTGEPRSATVVAHDRCQVLELTKSQFDNLLETQQRIRIHLMYLVGKRRSNSKAITPRLARSEGN